MNYLMWNMMIHACVGFLGSAQFGFNLRGVLYSLGIALITQGLELINIYRAQRNYVKAAAMEAAKKNKNAAMDLDAQYAEQKATFKKEAPLLYARNVAIFTAITVVAAEIAVRVYGV